MPGASAADSVLGTSTRTVTSPDSSAWTRVIEPRNVAIVTVLFAPVQASDRRTAIVQFPGGFVAEIHSPLIKTPQN